jgi:RNA recognition motif-containing protein
MSTMLHVANLSHAVGNDELERLFAGHGVVRSAEVVNQLASSDITGTGHVEMASDAAAAAAIAALNGARYGGADLVVARAEPGQRRGIDLPRMFASMNIPDRPADGGDARPRARRTALRRVRYLR